jgi:diguanylate cyclase (GGDEF)-like protein
MTRFPRNRAIMRSSHVDGDRKYDLRSLALIFSTAGALPMPIIGMLAPWLIIPGGMPLLTGVWCYTLLSLVLVIWCRPVSDRLFVSLSAGGMAGIAISAFLITDITTAHVVLCLMAAIPAMAAMQSRMRVVFTFGLWALAVVAIFSQLREPFGAATVIRLGATTMAVTFPTALVLGLRRSLERALSSQRAMSRTDPLTGLLNRRGLMVHGEELVATAHRQGLGLGLLTVDIDHFKAVNDRFGHAYGDDVLVDTAQALSECAGSHAVVARLGGEEFVLLMPADSYQSAVTTAEKVREAIADATTITVSIGAVFTADLNTGDSAAASTAAMPPVVSHHLAMIDELMAYADNNLYQAKQSGRNRVRASRPYDTEQQSPQSDSQPRSVA